MSGPSEREIPAALPSSTFDASVLKFATFMRLDMPAPNGIIRMTNLPGGAVLDIDGSVQTWNHYSVRMGDLAWGQTRPVDVLWVELWNLDNVFSTLLLNYDMEYKPAHLWQGWFNPTTGALLAGVRMWRGRTDRVQASGGAVRVSLVAENSSLGVTAPFIELRPSCQNIFTDPFSCKYGVLPTPSAPTVVDGGAGGSLGAATYSYRITAIGMGGLTLASTAGTWVNGAGSRKASLTWPAVANAVGYGVYGRTGGTEKHIFDVTTNSYLDNGSIVPVGNPPASNTTGQHVDCDRSRKACIARQNLRNRVAWDKLPTPSKPPIWNIMQP